MNFDITSCLNEKQKEAVLNGDGRVLVLSGAGSGKTRVIAHRIAYLLIEKGVSPYSILSVTFTNKAANEMKERVLRLLNRDSIPFLWIGTFHSVCARILREDIEKLKIGLNKHFTIFDRDDSKSLIKKILKEEKMPEEAYSPSEIIEYFSVQKRGGKSHQNTILNSLYQIYSKRLIESNAVDFDDLLLFSLKLLKDVEEVRKKYQERFKYILVDEYQDTNDIQEELLSILSQKWGNTFFVGDEDQSIYGFRGSKVKHIVEFPKRHQGVKIVRLEQNYRSYDFILKAASALVAHNTERLGKNLWTERKGGEKIYYFSGLSDREEANFVADSIKKFSNDYNFSHFAVLMRTNAQSRTIEETFINKNIPYQIVGGLKFYERKEIKDILAYIKLALNPYDRVSLLRIINTPPRGIGKATVDEIETISREREIPLFNAIKEGLEEKTLSSRGVLNLQSFIKIIEETNKKIKEIKPSEVVIWLMDEISYEDYLESHNDPNKESRVENIWQLVSALKEFEEKEGADFETFLERQALQSDQDELNEESSKKDSVKVMTIHSAKGLEFPVVFIIGVEDGYFPHEFSKLKEEEVEEERRLLYVGMTRAMDKLFLTNSRTRYVYGTIVERNPSPFLAEIPEKYIEKVFGIEPKKSFSWSNMNQFLEEKMFSTKEEKILKPGARVCHKTYGVGIILSTEGSGENLKVSVSFSRFGRKKLLAKLAKLEIL
ncbi:MAG: UvrD-helicase domain-containing protein [Acidobacteria bacterium]|nr:UvrD-helicase domain-containing protein [Acidobacteriota bacterium]